MSKKYKILLSAYACEPNKGSEPGVGWNFAVEMAKVHQVWVLTRRNNRTFIENELLKNPIEGLKFIYYDLPDKLIFVKKIIGIQAYYFLWQVFSFRTYSKANRKFGFDLIHHLTFNQYRTLSFGFFVKKPFVMGPVGGSEKVNKIFFPDLELATRLKERWRNLKIDSFIFKFIARLSKNKKVLAFSSRENYNNLKINKDGVINSIVIPAIGIKKSDFDFTFNSNNVSDTFSIIYAGRAEDWKGLLLFIRALEKAFTIDDKVNVKFIGIRNKSERLKVMNWLSKHKLKDVVELIDFIPRDKLIALMSEAHLTVYPAFRDSGSMAVLESCALACPNLCFSAGGQDMFAQDILIRIPVSNESYQANVNRMSEKLRWSYNHKSELKDIGLRSRDYVFKQFSWKSKTIIFSELYDELLNNN